MEPPGDLSVTVCCFVLLIPTPEEYRVPRVNPGVTASKLFPPLLPSLATPGPALLFLTDHSRIPGTVALGNIVVSNNR